MMFNRTIIIKLLWTLSLSIVLGACGQIPKAYRGEFVEQEQQLSLKLKASKGELQGSEVHLVSAARILEFKDLLAAKPGIYVRENPVNKKLFDVFWIEPDLSTRQEAGSMVWFESKVYYTLFDHKLSDQVSHIKMVSSGEGVVMLDLSTKLWQIGWPAGPTKLNFQRSK